MGELSESLASKAKARYKSEFNMWIQDLERYDKILQTVNLVAIRAKNFDIYALIPYYSVIHQLYMEIMPIIFKEKRILFDNAFENVWVRLTALKKSMDYGRAFRFPYDVLEALIEIERALRIQRQVMNLGMPVRKDISKKKEIGAVLVPKNKL